MKVIELDNYFYISGEIIAYPKRYKVFMFAMGLFKKLAACEDAAAYTVYQIDQLKLEDEVRTSCGLGMLPSSIEQLNVFEFARFGIRGKQEESKTNV